MGGRPCIRGQRVTVGMIVGQLGAGRTIADLLADHPYLERDRVVEALRCGAWRARERGIDLIAPTKEARTGDRLGRRPGESRPREYRPTNGQAAACDPENSAAP